MYSPDISKHTPRLYQLGRVYQLPMTEVANRLIAHGLEHLDNVFGWRPQMGRQSPEDIAVQTGNSDPDQLATR